MMRTAVVTGAGRADGIAAAVARALAREGWSVLATCWPAYDAEMPWGRPDGSRLVDELEAFGTRAAFLEEDLGDPGAAPRILTAAEGLGPVTAVVVAHAHSRPAPLFETSVEELDRHFAVNARGTLLLVAEFARRFRGSSAVGRIVVFTSGAGPGEVAYAASKAAVERMTRVAAIELAPCGLTVNAVDPGPTETGWMSAELRSRVVAEMPSGRVGTPEDSAGLVAFLLGDQAGWITGQLIRADGGWSTVQGSS